MWARGIEALLAGWLAASPLVMGEADLGLRIGSVVAAILVVGLAAASWRRPRSHVHLWQAAVAAGLVTVGWWYAVVEGRPAAMAQNWIVVGLVLAMFAIIPTRASSPPSP